MKNIPEEVRQRISATLKAKGFRPTVLPSREQCLANLGDHIFVKGMPAWNKGKPGAEAWNKGKSYLAVRGEKNGNWKGGKHHCEDCDIELASHYAKKCFPCHLKANRGAQHWSWKGGVTPEKVKLRTSPEYREWRLAVFNRDFFRCQMPECGSWTHLEANHIKPVRSYPQLVHDVSNGITLCRECHHETRYREAEFEPLFAAIIRLDFKLP